MGAFLAGSAYAMVRDVADGYIIASELTFKKFQTGDFQSFGIEADKLMREIRGNVPATGDVDATQKRQRRMRRLQQAVTLANNVRSRQDRKSALEGKGEELGGCRVEPGGREGTRVTWARVPEGTVKLNLTVSP